MVLEENLHTGSGQLAVIFCSLLVDLIILPVVLEAQLHGVSGTLLSDLTDYTFATDVVDVVLLGVVRGSLYIWFYRCMIRLH